MTGGPGTDHLEGGTGADRLYGGEGGDVLSDASSEADLLDGGPGGDSLNGGAGADVLTGGPGSDRLGPAYGVRRILTLREATCGTGRDSVRAVRDAGVVPADCEEVVARGFFGENVAAHPVLTGDALVLPFRRLATGSDVGLTVSAGGRVLASVRGTRTSRTRVRFRFDHRTAQRIRRARVLTLRARLGAVEQVAPAATAEWQTAQG